MADDIDAAINSVMGPSEPRPDEPASATPPRPAPAEPEVDDGAPPLDASIPVREPVDAGSAQTASSPIAPAQPKDPLDDTLDSVLGPVNPKQQTAAKFLAWHAANSGVEPEQAREVLGLAEVSGYEPAFVAKNLEAVRKKFDPAQVDWNRVAAETPALAEWATQGKMRAPAVKDDLEHMSALEWSYTAPWTALKDATFQLEASLRGAAALHGVGLDEGLARAAGDSLKDVDPNRARIAEIEAEHPDRGDYGAHNLLSRSMVGAAKVLPMIVGDQLVRVTAGPLVGAAGAVAAQVAGGGPADPAADVGSVVSEVASPLVASSGFNYLVSAGQMRNELANARDADGNPLDPDAIKHASEAAGVGGALIGALAGPTGSKLGGALGQRIASRLGGGFAAKVAGRFTAHEVSAAVIGGTQAAINSAAQQEATTGKVDAGKLLEDTGHGAAQMASDMLLVSGFHGVQEERAARAFIAHQGQQVATAESATRLGVLNEAVQKSKALGSLPEADRADLVKRVSKDIPHVYVDSEAVTRLAQERKVTPAQMAATIVGDSGEAWQRAQQNGGELVVPMEAHASFVAKDPKGANALFQDSKLYQDADTPRVARQKQVEFDKRAADLAKLDPEQMDEGPRRIYDDVRSKVAAAGRPAAEADHAGRLAAAWFGTLADRFQKGGSDTTATDLYAYNRFLVEGPRGRALAEPEGGPEAAYPEADLHDDLEHVELPVKDGVEVKSGVVPTEGEMRRAGEWGGRMRDPQRQQAASDFLDYVRKSLAGDTEARRPALPNDLEDKLAERGVFDPSGYTPPEERRRETYFRNLSEAKRRAEQRRMLGKRTKLEQPPTESQPTSPARPEGHLPDLRQQFAGLNKGEQTRRYFTDYNGTGLLNSRGYEAKPRDPARPRTAEVGVEGFKRFNDHFGHDAGDRMLNVLARATREAGVPDAVRTGNSIKFDVSSPEDTQRVIQKAEALLGYGVKVTGGTSEPMDDASMDKRFQAAADAHSAARDKARETVDLSHRKAFPGAFTKGEKPIDYDFGTPATENGKPLLDQQGQPVLRTRKPGHLKPASNEAGWVEKRALERARPFVEAHQGARPVEAPELSAEHHQTYAQRLLQHGAEHGFDTIHLTPEKLLTLDGFYEAEKAVHAEAKRLYGEAWREHVHYVAADARGAKDTDKAFGEGLSRALHGKPTDEIFAHVAQTLHEAGGAEFNVARPHGDEFYAVFLGGPKEEAAAKHFFETVDKDLEGEVFARKVGDKYIVQEGVRIAHGHGTDFDTADRTELPRAKSAQDRPSEPGQRAPQKPRTLDAGEFERLVRDRAERGAEEPRRVGEGLGEAHPGGDGSVPGGAGQGGPEDEVGGSTLHQPPDLIPPEVFHGTVADFDRFDPDYRGSNTNYPGADRAFFFAGSASDAGFYRDIGRERVAREEGEDAKPKGRVLRARLHVKNPFVLDGEDNSTVQGSAYQSLIDDDKAALDYAEAHGHDAVVWPNGNFNNSGYTVAVFDPDHIETLGVLDRPRDAGGGTFEARRGKGARGEITFTSPDEHGQRTYKVKLSKDADPSTLLHELGHFFGHVLGDVAQLKDAPQGVRDDYASLLKWMGYSDHADRVASLKEHADLQARKAAGEKLSDAERERLRSTTAKEERLSHGWEQYALEGKAPSAELMGPFVRMKNWLLRVYRGLRGDTDLASQNLQATYRANHGEEIGLSDEVRRIFDRWLASDEEVDRQQAAQAAAAPTSEKLLAAMTPEQRTHYQQVSALATERAKAELVARIAKAEREENSEFFKSERERLGGEVQKEMDADPTWRMLRYLTHGDTPEAPGKIPTLLERDGKPLKLSREDVREQYGKEVAAELARQHPGVLAKSGEASLHPDSMAELLGYDRGGDQLVRDLAAMPSAEDHKKAEVQNRMEAAYGPHLLDNPKALAEEATAALHDRAAVQKALLERRLMAKALGAGETGHPLDLDPALLERTAERLVGEQKVGDLLKGQDGAAGYYLRAERSSAKRAMEAMEAGKLDEALSANEAQLLSMHLYKEARSAQDALQKAGAVLERSAEDPWRTALGKADVASTPEGRPVDHVFLGAHEAILSAIGMSPGAERPAPAAVDRFVAKVGADAVGFDPDTIRALLAQPKDSGDLTLAETRQVVAAVKGIRHAARQVTELEVQGKRESKAEWFKQAAERASQGKQIPAEAFSSSGKTFAEKAAGALRGGSAYLTSIDNYLDALDGHGKDGGPWRQVFRYDRLDARSKLVELDKAVVTKVASALEKLPKALRGGLDQRVTGLAELLPVRPEWRVQVRAPETRADLFALFLNAGNEGNRQRLRDGNGWSDEQVNRALQLLKPEEARFLQGLLDTIDSLHPELSRVYERRTGLPLGKVDATPLTIGGETFRGGYFPIKYDARLSKQGVFQASDVERALFPNGAGSPTVFSGHTAERQAQVTAPVALEWGTVQSHLAQVVQDVAMGDWVRKAARLVLDPKGQALLDQKLGPERRKLFLPWLRDIASDRAGAVADAAQGTPDFVRMLSGVARSRFSKAVMSLNLPSTLAHLTDPLAALADTNGVGETAARTRFMVQAYAKALAPGERPEWALSKELAYRDARETANIRKALDAMKTPSTPGLRELAKVSDAVEHVSTLVRHRLDIFHSRTLWQTGFDEAIAEGLGQQEASRRGDDLLMKTLPSGDIAERSAVLRTKSGLAAVVLFHGYANKMFNLWMQAPIARAVDRGWRGAPRSAADLTSKWLVMGAVAALGAKLAGHGPKDDEDASEWGLRKLLLEPFNELPVIGGFLEAAVEGKEASPRTVPEAQMVADYVNKIHHAIKKADEGGGNDEEVWQAVGGLAGAALGPVGQVNRSTSYLQQMQSGQLPPQGPLDVGKGLVYGPPRGR